MPNHVLVGVPDRRGLEKVVVKLRAAGVRHYCWHEPDHNLGFTAIATEPLSQEQKMFLANYRLWKHECAPAARLCEQPVLTGRMQAGRLPGAPYAHGVSESTAASKAASLGSCPSGRANSGVGEC